MTPEQFVQQLLRDGEECLQRAREGMHAHGDRIVVAQDLAGAAESFKCASEELALIERRSRKAQVARG